MLRKLRVVALSVIIAGALGAQGFGWAFCVGDLGNESANRVASDGAGNTYVTGYYEGTVDFDPGAGVLSRTSNGGRDIFVAKYSALGALIWVDVIGGSGNDSGNGICVDGFGHVFITGTFWNTADFDPGPGTNTLTVTYVAGGGAPDPFVVKLDASGALLWARNFGGASNDEGDAISIDSSGNVYSTGLFYNFTGIPNDFDPGPGTLTLPAAGTSGWQDIYVSKLDGNGNLVWAVSIIGPWVKRVSDIDVDSLENVYLTGGFQQTVDFDPGTGTQNRTALGSDGFLLRLTNAGAFDWVSELESSNGSSTVGIASVLLDPAGGYFLCGDFNNGPVDLDPSAAVNNQTSIGSSDIFVSRLDASRNLVWVRTIGSTSLSSPEAPSDMVKDATGNLYIVGRYQGNTDFDPGPGTQTLLGNTDSQAFFLKLDANGNYIWAGSFGNPSDADSALGVALDSNLNIVLCGSMRGTGDFDPTTGTFNLTSAGPGGSGAPFDAYVVKLTQDFPMIEVRESSPITGALVASGAAASGARDFGIQNTYAGPATSLSIYVRNIGTANMTLGLPTLTGPDSGEFAIDTTGYTTAVAAGSNTSFLVSFDPATVGNKAATVSFTHDATMWTFSPFTFDLAGVAVEPSISMPLTPLTFTSTAVGIPAASQFYVVTATNLVSGIQVTAPSSFEVSASASGPWSASFTLPTTGGAVHLRYLPASAGSHSGNVSHTTVGAPASQITVQGNVIPISSQPSKDEESGGCTIQEDLSLTKAALLIVLAIVAASVCRRRWS